MARLVRAVQLDQLLHGREEGANVEDERRQRPHLEVAIENHMPTDEQQDGLSDGADGHGAGRVDSARPCGVEVRIEMRADHVDVVNGVLAAAVVRRDHADAGEALGDVRQHVGDAVADAPVPGLGDLAEPDAHEERRGHHHEQGEQGKRHAAREEHDCDHDERERLHGEVDEAFLEQLGERFDVARHACHEHAGLLVRVVPERLALQV